MKGDRTQTKPAIKWEGGGQPEEGEGKKKEKEKGREKGRGTHIKRTKGMRTTATRRDSSTCCATSQKKKKEAGKNSPERKSLSKNVRVEGRAARRRAHRGIRSSELPAVWRSAL